MNKPRSLFRHSALVSGLVTKEQIRQAEEAVRKQRGDEATEVDDETLANKLVDMQLLTAYQGAQLREGRTKLNLGPYIVTDWIGQGGMGQVYKAEHEVMGRVVAVKVLPLHKATPGAINNFTREIRTQAQLDHPNLVRAYDAGHDGKVHYLVTEYVPGTDLRRLVRSQGPLTMQQAANIVRQAALGLEYAHKRQLIHRDVKPGNILVTPKGVAKVSDLGLAGFMHEAEEDPRAGRIVGTADYWSPEQIRTPQEISSVSDIYSLGCTLYYAVTGKVPFPGGSSSEKARRHLQETPWHPRRFNPDVSEEFVEIIADTMEKDPAQRIADAGEVASRLAPWASEKTSSLPSQKLVKSPWMPPPVPSDMFADDAQDTDVGSYDELDSRAGESQYSQNTDPLGSASQDTRSNRRRYRGASPPPLAFSEPVPEVRPLSRGVSVAIALAISIPISMLLGALLSFLLMSLFGGQP